MKQVTAMALFEKHTEGLIFENRTSATVNDILTDDEANDAFKKIDGNIAGMEWEAEPQDLEAHMTQLKNNQYAALARNEYNE